MDFGLRGKTALVLGGAADSDEYANVAAFLASERAAYITGSVIRVDGGMITSI
jgi:3-oxoacyl-[acyl-carrier protein] reductase